VLRVSIALVESTVTGFKGKTRHMHFVGIDTLAQCTGTPPPSPHRQNNKSIMKTWYRRAAVAWLGVAVVGETLEGFERYHWQEK